MYIVGSGEVNHDVPNQPLLEPTRNVSVLVTNGNSSNDDDGIPDGIFTGPSVRGDTDRPSRREAPYHPYRGRLQHLSDAVL